MNKKQQSSSIRIKIHKNCSQSKFRFTQNHPLNKSPTKNVPSFNTGSLRLLEPTSQTPNKFYDIPEYKSKKSTSFGYGTKTNFVKKDFIEPTRYRIASSFDLRNKKKFSSTSFGISRQEFYKGKQDKSTCLVGPGNYNLQLKKLKNTFYMGMKLNRNDQTISPGPGRYDISPQNRTLDNDKSPDNHNSTMLRIKGPRMKTQYFQKGVLDKYDNKVPGPGAYEISSSSNSLLLLKKFKNSKPKLPQCPRFKTKQQQIPPPGNYQLFSQFG